MSRLTFERLTVAWRGEATDFTPLLNEQLDALGDAVGIDLASKGTAEVRTAGGRSIDIVAEGSDGAEFVIENQYGSADHDHLTRGLAYAVARRARGLIVVAEQHRDEFRAVADYLNELAEHDADRGIAIWLVEPKAVRIESSPWAPLFTTVVRPNAFTTRVEREKQSEPRLASLDEFYATLAPLTREPARQAIETWLGAGHKVKLKANYVVLEAAGPAATGRRVVLSIYTDGHVLVPFQAYAGVNSGLPIPNLTTEAFRAEAGALFGLSGTSAASAPGWLSADTALPLVSLINARVPAPQRHDQHPCPSFSKRCSSATY